MYGKARAPEYQGTLGATLEVNSSYEEVLATAKRAEQDAATAVERARALLAVAEAHRRLGQAAEAGAAWRASYRAAREADAPAAMAWALWSGGTLARQCGSLPLARRLLGLAVPLARAGGDRTARGYALAGLAETGRIQGDYEAVADLHEELLREARAHGEARHIVWAMSGIAQMCRNTGEWDRALALFEESAGIAAEAEDHRGSAWSLRGVADVLSLRGETDRALLMLSRAARTCREMHLASALAYNHKMRGNVLYRAARYPQARRAYTVALTEFAAIQEPRGTALARLGLVKTLAQLGRPTPLTLADLDTLDAEFTRLGLSYARRTITEFRTRLPALAA
ncbi:tetratricopeptide repeat protein [Streptomyces tremellae]|uniref:Tetratricopeptide repeat protein n=1 Tax=Streptomyces tremellae TaxID=1124239 RepID=A0ABP7FI84_9ACTN